MLPPKKSIYRSWDNLSSFLGEEESRQMGSRSSLIRNNDLILLVHQDHSVLMFSEDRIIICRPTYRTKTRYYEIANPILSLYGWYYGEVTFGPHKKVWRALKPTNVSPGTPESDYRSVAPVERRSSNMYTMLWNGKIVEHGGRLTESQVKKYLLSYDKRSAASRRVRQFAYQLGFPNTAKMGGFKLPRVKTPEMGERLNLIARTYGYQHVAHAWANGFVLPTDTQEIEMIEAGMGILIKEFDPKEHEVTLFNPSKTLWLRQRLLDGETRVEYGW